jgi:(1->4)-alpha-D-glucan 1-alpha-D-glucosylmutase
VIAPEPYPSHPPRNQSPRAALALRAPVATYRLQLHRDFTFRHVQAVVPYLRALGITDCYTSPVLTAREGSTHGYDICNHGALNPELGTIEDLRAIAETLRAAHMGLIVDFVPNHMGIDPRTNHWWRDVLENGASSPYARFFDIDWLPVKAELRDKVLLPILGDQYGAVLERGELQLAYDSGVLVLRYFDRSLPINPRKAPLVLGYDLERLVHELGEQHADVRELRSILSSLTNLPAMTESDEASIAERQREKEVARERLAALVPRSLPVSRHIDRAVAVFNGTTGDAESFDRLHALLEVGAYRLAYWRTAFDEINYRRFFDVNELAGLRMEDPRVFAATHALLLDLIAEGLVTGVRIDHPDGLFDPTAYFRSLRAAIRERRPAAESQVYVVVEKILGRGERMRDSWDVDGTTGYNALNTLNGLFVHPEGLADLRRIYRRFANYRVSATDTIYAGKRLMMRTAMASELNVLTRALSRLCEADRRFRDFTLNGLRRALVEVIACFPVYRTYVSDDGASAEDEAVVDAAITEARRRNPVQEPSIFAFIRQALLPGSAEERAADPMRDRRVAFAEKFQQYTAPVVAKGLEDTAFYNDVALLSANEVGGDLRFRSRSVAELHSESLHRLTRWPLEMLAGSTHDTKRGEDARARINVISERPDEWRSQVMRWAAINEPARIPVNGITAPDRNDEWMFYQALVGAWPAELQAAPIPSAAPREFIDRMQTFMLKALKEAKRHTAWLHENVEYEQGVRSFVDAVLGGDLSPAFLAAFLPFQRRVAWFGMVNSLSQLVIRLGSPGVPDIYQGSELWDFSLVDPDNRRPVDFEHCRSVLDGLASPDLADLLANWPDGRVKMATLTTGLKLRRDYPEVFLHGEYVPLSSETDDPHVIAFSRKHAGHEFLVAVPRFVATLLRGTVKLPFGTERWRTTSVRLSRRLADSRFVNVFTQERIEPVVHSGVPWLLAGSMFQSWPVAILQVRQRDSTPPRKVRAAGAPERVKTTFD